MFKNFEHIWFGEGNREYIELFYELILNTITFHDIGKINPLFQKLKMENKMFLEKEGNITLGSEHSIISAILYLEFYLPKSKNFSKDIRKFFRLLTYINAYIISKHHGNLGRFEKFLEGFYEDDGDNRYKSEIIKEEYKQYFKPECTFIEKQNSILYAGTLLGCEITDKKESINLYAYEKLIYSLLIASDYYATSEYINEFVIDSHGIIEEINKISQVFSSTEINESIKEYRKNKYLNKDIEYIENVKNINVLRSELYLDAEKNYLTILIQNILSRSLLREVGRVTWL